MTALAHADTWKSCMWGWLKMSIERSTMYLHSWPLVMKDAGETVWEYSA